MTAGILIYGTEGNFELAHKTWKFLENFDCDLIFSIGIGVTTENRIKEIYPKSKFHRETFDNENDTINNLKLIKSGFSLFDKKYDYIILMKINSYIIVQNGFEFLYDCDQQDCICGYRPIKLIGKKLFYVPDYFFIGNNENMEKLIKNLPDNCETNITDIIPKILLENDLYVRDIGPYMNMEEVYNNVLPNQTNLSPHELKILAAEWRQKN